MVSVEDPFDQDDRDGWKRFLTKVDIQVVDNDLTATNPKLIARAAELRARNCLLLKVNQIRLVTKSIRARVLRILVQLPVQIPRTESMQA